MDLEVEEGKIMSGRGAGRGSKEAWQRRYGLVDAG